MAAAATKCFYFQRDHWTGSIVQGQQPELWHWDGDYFYDRARGVGGVSVRNFRIGGHAAGRAPYVPAAYQPLLRRQRRRRGRGGAGVATPTRPAPRRSTRRTSATRSTAIAACTRSASRPGASSTGGTSAPCGSG